MNETPKKREWVKNAAIVFLAVILVLTFFSNTIMNRSLPEVATQDVTDGSIVSKVRGSGTVTANGNNQVKMEKTRVIRAVMVKAGQEVKAGDVLFTLGEGSSEEIEALEEKIRNLQNSYNRTAVSGQIYTDYSYDERAIDNKLQAWENAMDKLAYYEEKIAAAAEDSFALEQAEMQVELTKALLDDAQASYNESLAIAEQNVEEVRANVEAETAQEISEKTAELDFSENQQTLYDDYSDHTIQLSQKEAEIENKRATVQGIEEAIRVDIESIDMLVERQMVLQILINEATSQEEKEKYELELDKNEGTLKTLRGEVKGYNDEEAELNLEIIDASSVRDDIKAYIDANYPTAPTDYSSTIAELEARLELLYSEGAHKELIDEAIAELNAISPTTYNEAKAKYDAAVLARDNLLERTDPMLNYDYQQALNACKAAEDAYYASMSSLDQKQANDWKSQAITGVDLNATWQELEVAKAKLAELTGTDGENITAKVAGTVTSVECNAGDKKMKDDVLCTIEVPDQGYTLSFTVTNEQASRLRIGDQATVSNFYWGNEVNATLSSIKTDPKNPQNNKLLTFDLEGNVTSGSQLTISVGQKSANYDLIIPSSSIRSDSNGSFVFKVEAKNSPLGNRYIAKRVPVEVLASDDNNSAVTAELQYGDYVITTSSAPIKNGAMVRLANAS